MNQRITNTKQQTNMWNFFNFTLCTPEHATAAQATKKTSLFKCCPLKMGLIPDSLRNFKKIEQHVL